MHRASSAHLLPPATVFALSPVALPPPKRPAHAYDEIRAVKRTWYLSYDGQRHLEPRRSASAPRASKSLLDSVHIMVVYYELRICNRHANLLLYGSRWSVEFLIGYAPSGIVQSDLLKRADQSKKRSFAMAQLM